MRVRLHIVLQTRFDRDADRAHREQPTAESTVAINCCQLTPFTHAVRFVRRSQALCKLSALAACTVLLGASATILTSRTDKT